jgi:hypothetical protein
MSNARDRVLKGAETHKPAIARLLAEADSAVERLHMIVAMQQFVFDHHIKVYGEAEALDQITLLYHGHVKRKHLLM